MSKVDDELTRRLHRGERPVETDAVFERLERRRLHRERVRRVQGALLAFAVLAGTAVGFVALREAFGEGGRDIGESPALAGNGEIVFSREGVDGRFHLYAVQPDGSAERQITDDATNDTDPAVSPGGETIAYVHELDRKIPEESETDPSAPRIRVIATVPIDGGVVGWHTPEAMEASNPAWSSDGKTIAFVGWAKQSAPPGFEAPHRYRAIFTVDATNGSPDRVTDGGIPSTSDPTWSPRDRSIAFAGGSCASSCEETTRSDLYIVDVSSTDVRRLTPLSGDINEEGPAWSPDGTRIAFIHPGEQGDEVWTVALDGSDETFLATGFERSLEPDLAWAPDGSALLVSDGEWIYRVDATPSGDPRGNFVQLVKGRSPAWQPLPAGSEPQPSPTSEPTVSASPEPAGRDIGLGVAMCDLEVLHGIDWDGTGIDGAAWTGAPVDEDGRCSSSADVQHVVAVDRDGDGIAEQGSTSTLRSCLQCRPFDTVDLNDDGVLELVVLEEASSTPTYSLYEVNRPGSERALGVYPIFVAPPGAPAMNLDANEPTRFMVGGDEGFSGSIACENDGPGPPILRYTWVRGAVDTDTELRVDVTRLSFGEDGVFHIESADRFSVPRNPEPTDLKSTEPACGVDFHPAA